MNDLLRRASESLHFLTDEWRGDPEWIEEERKLLAEIDSALEAA
jgi:hypothetical protein